jgi:hypothetical protein
MYRTGPAPHLNVRRPLMTNLCHVSKTVKGECDTCGRTVEHLHMPEEVHGWYCALCCPVCSHHQQVKAA